MTDSLIEHIDRSSCGQPFLVCISKVLVTARQIMGSLWDVMVDNGRSRHVWAPRQATPITLHPLNLDSPSANGVTLVGGIDTYVWSPYV